MILLVGSAYADCAQDIQVINETKVFKNYLKSNLFSFLANPDESNVNITEVNATLYFYISFTVINSSIICNESGDTAKYNGVNISEVTKKFIDSPKRNVIPRCADGTLYGECSNRQPDYCLSGELVPMCSGLDKDNTTLIDNCGCPGNSSCYENTGYCDT